MKERAKSKIVKHGKTPNLYIDEVTGIFYLRVYDAKTKSTITRSLATNDEKKALRKLTSTIRNIKPTEKKTENKLVKDYYAGYLAHEETRELAEATTIQNELNWRLHVEPFWGNVVDTEIDQDKYSEYLGWHKRTRGIKIKNALKVLRKLFKYMKKKGVKIDVDVYLPKKEADAENEEYGTYITPEEMAAIRAVKDVSVLERDRLPVELGYVLGMRIEEIAELQRNRFVNNDGRYEIRLKGEDTKTRQPRNIAVPKSFGERIETYLQTHTSRWVFPAHMDPKKPTSTQVVEGKFKNILRIAGIRRHIEFHDLRRTCATNMADLGVDHVKACANLGMSLRIYLKRYVKKHKLNLSSVADELSKLVGDS